MKPTSFTSVHDYLDMVFKDTIPNEEAIINAKKIYWRAYNTDLKRRKRQEFTTLHICFSKKEYGDIQAKLSEAQSVPAYIKYLVLEHFKNRNESVTPVNTSLIEQQLFLIAEYLQELLESKTVNTEKIEALEQYMQTLEQVIQDSL